MKIAVMATAMILAACATEPREQAVTSNLCTVDDPRLRATWQ